MLEEQLALFAQKPAGHDPGGKTRLRLPAGMLGDAEFGGEGQCYRYKLFRRWAPGPIAMFGMMNCSTAEADVNDPTVAKVCQISRGLGYGGAYIGNACAYRATDRMRLLTVADPVGPRNHAAILEMVSESSLVVIAHGRLPGDLQRHAHAMCELIQGAGHRLHVLRLTPDGTPMHPLARGKAFIPVSTVPSPWIFTRPA
jgi:hypothetical protein